MINPQLEMCKLMGDIMREVAKLPEEIEDESDLTCIRIDINELKSDLEYLEHKYDSRWIKRNSRRPRL